MPARVPDPGRDAIVPLARRMSDEGVGHELGISTSAARRFRQLHGIPKFRELPPQPPVTGRLLSVLLGSVLGDAHLTTRANNGNSALTESHALNQKAYLEWKVREWGPWVSTFRSRPPQKPTHQEAWTMYVHAGSVMGYWRERFYDQWEPQPSGRRPKRFPSEVVPLVTPLALAVWYMDDGTGAGSWPTFSCHRRSHEVALAILAEYGLVGTPTVGGSDCIQIKGDQARALLHIMGPHTHPSLRYKLATGPDQSASASLRARVDTARFLA